MLLFFVLREGEWREREKYEAEMLMTFSPDCC